MHQNFCMVNLKNVSMSDYIAKIGKKNIQTGNCGIRKNMKVSSWHGATVSAV
jgi:hypothetical protein